MLAALGLASLGVATWMHSPGRVPSGGTHSDGQRESVAVASLRKQLAGTSRELERDAKAALAAPDPEPRAFDELADKTLAAPWRGIILYRYGRPAAWSGQIYLVPDTLERGLSVVTSEFYTALHFTAKSGNRTAVATALIDAVAPASRIARSLDEALEKRLDIAAFIYGPPEDSSAGDPVVFSDGRPLLRAAAIPLPRSALQLARATRIRSSGVALLGILLATLLFLAFRDRRQLAERLLALAVTVAAVAVVPWNTLSNMAFMFDPAIYFSRIAGPLSASAGATLFICSMLLAGSYTVLRSMRFRREGRADWLALPLAAGGLAGARVLASGIGQPPWGTTPALWVAWELPLFLVAFTGLISAVWIVRRRFRRVAFFKLAVATGMMASAFAIWLVWTNTLQVRLRLASEDMAGLANGDEYTAALLTRFGEELGDGNDLATRAGLLRRYALSDLAAAELPVMMTTWGADGMALATLEVSQLDPDTAAVASVVRKTFAGKGAVLQRTPGGTGMQFVLGVPSKGGVTTVIVAPQSRLVSPGPYSALFGLQSSRGGDAPYTIALTDAGALRSTSHEPVRWRRTGDELHADRIVPVTGGHARAHAEIDLRSFGARAQRAALLTILNLAVAGFLWLLVTFAERGFLRWLRRRTVLWIYTYRARLTLALFLFFVVPALSFALWSYRRLRADDRQVRELLVDESLQAATLEIVAHPLDTMLRHFDAPILVYANGEMSGSSEKLLDDLKPLGLFLPPPVHMRFGNGGELTSSTEIRVANANVLVGYRAAVGPGGQRYVLAAPARRDELVLDRRRRDLGILVLFATAVGGFAAFWLSGLAARRLARDLELSRVEVARAERVLAWGEMARQIAHEIKNPLTPIRLGVQHLRRARTDSRLDFDRVLDENVTRILTEIDRLDEIARTFSRYGSLPADLPPAEAIDIAPIVRDVMDLEQIGAGKVRWQISGIENELCAFARSDELRDVLLNVFENARLAGASEVRVHAERDGTKILIDTVDNGSGIAPEVMPRIFEPHFSTRTTGSGLGLAVSRRLVESWGGKIDVTNNAEKGARVLLVLRAASP